jgi:hypothetical protein
MHMKGKFLFVVGLGVGYVLGTRAGRERYEQIRQAAERVWNQPTVQEGVETAKSFALSRVGDVGDTVLSGAKKLVKQISAGQGSTTRSSSTGSSTGSRSSGRSSTSGTKSTGSKSGAAKSGSSGSKSGSSASKSKTSGSGSGSSSSS